jgi:hypothetical protein
MKSTQTVRITVLGRLGERFAQAFDGMLIVPRPGATEIVGELIDQAQLHGLLARIRDLGLSLASVTVTDVDSAAGDQEGG